MPANTVIPLWLRHTVKVAHYINCVVLGITLGAYTIDCIMINLEGIGIALQFFLGCYQLIIAILATLTCWKWKIFPITKLLKTYWLLILLWILCAGILALIINLIHNIETDSSIRAIAIILIIVIPIVIASYFVWITYYWKSIVRN